MDVVVASDAATAWATMRLPSAAIVLSVTSRVPAAVAPIVVSEPAAMLEVMAPLLVCSLPTAKAVSTAKMVPLVDIVESTVSVLSTALASVVEIEVPVSAKVLVTALPDASDVIALELAEMLAVVISPSPPPVPVTIEAIKLDAVPPASTVEVTPRVLTCDDPRTAILVPPAVLLGASESNAADVSERLPKSKVIALDARFARAVEPIVLLSKDMDRLVIEDAAVCASGVKDTLIPASSTVDAIASVDFVVVEY